MTLDQETINAIAAATAPLIVQQLRAAESRSQDARYLASLPLAEQKRLSREQRRQQVAAQKLEGKK